MNKVIIATALALASLSPALAAPNHSVSNRATSAIPKGHFIDPETGLMCQNSGIATICVSPPADMTIHYTNKHGLTCTRAGLMSVCSNL